MCCFYFLAYLKLIRLKFDVLLKYFEVNILILCLSEIYEMRDIGAVLLSVFKENLNICMHLDVYELIWFRLSMMIDTSELYVFLCKAK